MSYKRNQNRYKNKKLRYAKLEYLYDKVMEKVLKNKGIITEGGLTHEQMTKKLFKYCADKTFKK